MMNLRSLLIFIFWRWLKKPEIGAKYRFFEDVDPFQTKPLYIPLEIKGTFIYFAVFGQKLECVLYNDSCSLKRFMAFYVKVS